METITKKILLLAIVVFATSLTVYSQNYKIIQTAFDSSYAREKRAEYSKAIESMKAVYDEKSYEINLRLGWLSYMSGFFTESSTYYNKAIELKPYSIEAKMGVVYPLSGLGNWDKIINYYKEILKIDPQNTTVNYRLGSIYYGRNDYSTASKYLEKVINLYPFDYDTVILYAWTNFKLGSLREAKVLFNKALMIRPNDSSALEGLSYIK